MILRSAVRYNKPVVVKRIDGSEMHRTFKLKTPHQETHCVCTTAARPPRARRTPPRSSRRSSIVRWCSLRTLGSKTHDDQEFEKNLMNQEVKHKMRAFRILTCLRACSRWSSSGSPT